VAIKMSIVFSRLEKYAVFPVTLKMSMVLASDETLVKKKFRNFTDTGNYPTTPEGNHGPIQQSQRPFGRGLTF
jgi:hypothetical protein